MAAGERVGRLPVAAEIALASAAGAGAFATAAVAFADIDSVIVAAFLGAAFLLAVIAIARFASVAYAVPVGMAGLLAFDWFYLAPTHPLEFPDSANLVDLIIYLAGAVLLGVLSAHAVERAAAAERARGEIADEQAALRRVATLVARGVAAGELFAAVATEAGTLLDVHGIRIARYEDDTELVHVAEWSEPGHDPPSSYDRAGLEGMNVSAEVLGTGRAVRIDNYQDIVVRARSARVADLKSVVGAPVVVEGRVWGVMIAWSMSGLLPGDTERRLTDFAGLVATAISNTDARTELIASRARLVAASDEARRRFERDLHDGIQQRLVSLALELNLAEAVAPRENAELAARLGHVRQGLTGALDDLRELSRGIHPAILSEGGLVPALKALARRSPVPVELRLSVGERLADQVEVGTYYVVSEALTNAAKHARASNVEVTAHVRDGRLQLTIGDDGVGGADPARGSGLTGLADRVSALGGTIAITSQPGKGTSLRVELPIVSQ
ncbi:MAG: hypothetical protein QOC94_2416 [Actinoplanes sp.]|nr:hypothetical protein [Actinoplanes sp.]